MERRQHRTPDFLFLINFLRGFFIFFLLLADSAHKISRFIMFIELPKTSNPSDPEMSAIYFVYV